MFKMIKIGKDFLGFFFLELSLIFTTNFKFNFKDLTPEMHLCCTDFLFLTNTFIQNDSVQAVWEVN